MKAFIFLLMCGLGAGTLAAQTLTGKVTDMKQQAVEAATVVLQAADSTYIDANTLSIKRSSAREAVRTRGHSCLRQKTMRWAK